MFRAEKKNQEGGPSGFNPNDKVDEKAVSES